MPATVAPMAHLSPEDLGGALATAPDPELARVALSRVGEDAGARAVLAREDVLPVAVRLLGFSTAAADFLVANPSEAEVLGDVRARSRDELDRELEEDVESRGVEGGLRRFRRRAMLRVAARDLGGVPLEEVVTEITAIAEACLEVAIGHAALDGIAVIGLGKLGGGELNYASDVDVVFVQADGGGSGRHDAAERACAATIRLLSEPTAEGIALRVDPTLRPGGRAGALSRSLEAMREYYGTHAATWERQAMIKARPVAGDRVLGEAFVEMVAPVVYPAELAPSAIEEVRQVKVRLEEYVRARGKAGTEVKRGWGGIRDVEFAVQLLQIVHGRRDERLREPNTLRALATLAEEGYVAPDDAEALAEAYRFLRTLEHRLQIVRDLQTHDLPADRHARDVLARSLVRDRSARDGARAGARTGRGSGARRCPGRARERHRPLRRPRARAQGHGPGARRGRRSGRARGRGGRRARPPPGRDRAGQARGAGAELRLRPGHGLRLRGRGARGVPPRGRARGARARGDPAGRVGARRRPPARGAWRTAREVLRRLPRVLGAVRADLGVPGPDPGTAGGRRRGPRQAVLLVRRRLRLPGLPPDRSRGRDPPDARADRTRAGEAAGGLEVPLQARCGLAGRRAVRRGAVADAVRRAAPRGADPPDPGRDRAPGEGPSDRGLCGPGAGRGVRVPFRCEGRARGRPSRARRGDPAGARGAARAGSSAGVRGVPAPDVPRGPPEGHAPRPSGDGAGLPRGGVRGVAPHRIGDRRLGRARWGARAAVRGRRIRCRARREDRGGPRRAGAGAGDAPRRDRARAPDRPRAAGRTDPGYERARGQGRCGGRAR